jgi:GrpB-like predicted nucleotidyltransferase (UPF0157 family)
MEIVKFIDTGEISDIAEKAYCHNRTRILELLPKADVQHVGSTAIPGSITKGDLDIQVRVNSEDFEYAVKVLVTLYELNEGSTRTDFFTAFKDDSAIPPLGVQLTVVNSELDIFWKFRELLLANEQYRGEYDELKKKYNGREMDTYRTAKDEFFRRLMDSAEFAKL